MTVQSHKHSFSSKSAVAACVTLSISLGLPSLAFAQTTSPTSSASSTSPASSASSASPGGDTGAQPSSEKPEPNPELKNDSCNGKPLNVALVYDASGSVGYKGKKEYAKSTEKFLDSIVDKNISVASFYFTDRSLKPNPQPKKVTKESIEKMKKDIIAPINEISGGTDWAAGLEGVSKGHEKNKYDLVIFLTDGTGQDDLVGAIEGDPFTVGNGEGGRSIKFANDLKKDGVRIVGVGIGDVFMQDAKSSSPQKGGPIESIQSISGTKKDKDWYAGDWEKLSEALSSVAKGLDCTPSTTSEKPSTPPEKPSIPPEKPVVSNTPTSESQTPIPEPEPTSSPEETPQEESEPPQPETVTETTSKPSVVKNTTTVTSVSTEESTPETVKETVVETQAAPVQGPTVKTGGEVESQSFLDKVASIFR